MSKNILATFFCTKQEHAIVKEELERVGDSIARLEQSRYSATDSFFYFSGMMDEHVILCIKLRAPTISFYFTDVDKLVDLKEKYRQS